MDNKLSELSKPVAWTWNAYGMQHATTEEDESAELILDGVDVNPLYSQEYVSALLAELEAKDKRISELEAIRADASQVFKEIGNELGCNPDNESIMMAIDDLKANQMTGPLKDVLRRNVELEKRMATPVRLPDSRQCVSGDRYQWSDGVHNYRQDTIATLREQGLTVGDE